MNQKTENPSKKKIAFDIKIHQFSLFISLNNLIKNNFYLSWLWLFGRFEAYQFIDFIFDQFNSMRYMRMSDSIIYYQLPDNNDPYDPHRRFDQRK